MAGNATTIDVQQSAYAILTTLGRSMGMPDSMSPTADDGGA